MWSVAAQTIMFLCVLQQCGDMSGFLFNVGVWGLLPPNDEAAHCFSTPLSVIIIYHVTPFAD